MSYTVQIVSSDIQPPESDVSDYDDACQSASQYALWMHARGLRGSVRVWLDDSLLFVATAAGGGVRVRDATEPTHLLVRLDSLLFAKLDRVLLVA